MIKEVLESKQLDLNLIYEIDRNVYFRITDFLEFNQISDMYYHEEGQYSYIFFKNSSKFVEVIRLYKGDGLANEPSCEWTIIPSWQTNFLKGIITSKVNHNTEMFSNLTERVNGLSEYQKHYVIKNKKYEINCTRMCNSKNEYKDYSLTVLGEEVNYKIKELKESGYISFSICDDRSYLDCFQLKETIPYDEIFNQINDMTKQQVKGIMEQCMRVLAQDE